MSKNINADETQKFRDFYKGLFSTMKFYRHAQEEKVFFVEYTDLTGKLTLSSTKDANFRAFVNFKFREEFDADEVYPCNSALGIFMDKAILDNSTIEIYSRIYGNEEETFYFLADTNNTIIRINANGVNKISQSELDSVKFLKKSSTLEQAYPQNGAGLLETLRPFLNMDEELQILFVVNLVQQFIFGSSHFMSVISSPQGSGKTTFTKLWHQILDPTKASVAVTPKNTDELINHLANNYVICLDNAQAVNGKFSDVLCGAVTGTTQSKRKLYTDSEEIILELHNIIIVNGIDAVPKQPDLIERSLLFTLNKIPANQRKSELDIKNEFDKALPNILGAIFNTLAEYFKRKHTIHITGGHRMHNAYRDCYVIADILGVLDKFLLAFIKNQEVIQRQFEAVNPLISAISSYFDSEGTRKISNSTLKVYECIKPFSDPREFPKSASAFSRELRIQEDVLKKAGYRVMWEKLRDFTKLTIQKTGGGN